MLSKTKSYINSLVSIFFLLMLLSCKTTKNKFLNKAFHNTTTRYNWYFNANQSYIDGVKQLEAKHNDDYNELLSVYPLGTINDVQLISPQMDKALKKCAQAISKHSMLIKGKEYNKWVDDCYLLIGKAYFYKKEYIKSVEAFRLVSRQFEGQKSHFEAKIWLIRAFTELNEYGSVELLLDEVLSDETFPVDLNKELALSVANYYIHQKNYISAISELKEAISLTSKKNEKARYLFMVAQMYYSQNNYQEATNFFSRVIRISPDYQMTFNAKINIARSFDTSSEGSVQIEDELKKMLKDSKNNEFLDVIYFGLAELSFRQSKLADAIPLYIKSVSNSVNNDAQKSLSSAILAEIYYDNQSYRQSQAYYDTAVAFMNTNSERFMFASSRQKTLSELIFNLDVINHQDSIQRIALMPEKQRIAFIDNIIEKVKAEERRQKELENLRRSENNFFIDPQKNNSFNKMNQNKGLGWYFDNPNTLSFGFSEFNRKWGKRKLEDDWRRSNKKTLTFEGTLIDTLTEEFDPKKRESYLKGLPTTIQAIKSSNQKIIQAYFDAGVIYKEKLNDLNKSIETFEKLNTRFPKNQNRSAILYFLYRLNNEVESFDSAKNYKEQLISEFPLSDYAMLCKDPSYAEQIAQRNTLIHSDYESAYQMYIQSDYATCIKFCNQVNNTNPDNILYPNFELLKTMASGHNTSKDVYIELLTLIVEKYPNHSAAESAEEIITYLKVEKKELDENNNDNEDTQYVNKPKVGHYFILLFKEFDLELSIAKTIISDYHAEYYRLERLNVSDLLFDQHTHMLIVRDFSNKNKAMMYYDAFINGELIGAFGSDYDVFVISGPNFTKFYENKDIVGYKQAFQDYYLN